MSDHGECTHISPDDESYPIGIEACLRDDAPRSLAVLGTTNILSDHKVAVISSVKCPGQLILQTYDLAQEIREANTTVMGGFHSPMERECLNILLRGTNRLILCPARSIETMRIPQDYREPLQAKRLVIVSPFDAKSRRKTAKTAEFRNAFAAACADVVLIPYASPGGKTEKLCRKAVAWGKPVFTIDSEYNTSLVDMGAVPVGVSEAAERILANNEHQLRIGSTTRQISTAAG